MATPRKPAHLKEKVGRKSTYTAELAAKVLHQVATNPSGLRKMYREIDWFPEPTVIYSWRYMFPEFRQQYADAYKFKAEIMAEEIIEIADDTSNDYVLNDKGEKVFCTENYQQRRLRTENRRFVASKLVKAYADKIEQNVNIVTFEDAIKKMHGKIKG